MVITKRESSTYDGSIVVLYAKKDGDDTVVYPVLVDSNGRLILSPTSGDVSSATCGSVTVASSSTTVLSARPDRHAAILVNDSDEDIYLKYGSGATLNSGIRLNAAGGSIVEDLYTGAITAICASGNKNLTVTEL